MVLQELNLALFQIASAGHDPNALLLKLAAFVSSTVGWLSVAVLVWAAWRRPAQAFHALAALAFGAAMAIIARSLAAWLEVPRPFMVGLSPLHVSHGDRGGLPSTHATVMFTIAFMLLTRRDLRSAGWILVGLATVTGWSRVYLGLHFPADIAAGMLLAGAASAVALLLEKIYRAHGTVRLRARRAKAQMPVDVERMASPGTGSRIGLFVWSGSTLVAVLVGLMTPHVIPLAFLQEGGPVETGTVVLYLAAALVVLGVQLPDASRMDRLAIGLVLLAFAAREADLHISMFGISILKARFYSDVGSAEQITMALAVLMPIALSLAWLAVRHGRHWLSAPFGWSSATATVAVFLAALVFAKGLDRLPDTIIAVGLLQKLPSTFLHVLLSIEEIVELTLPLLALLAMVQSRPIFSKPGRGIGPTPTRTIRPCLC